MKRVLSILFAGMFAVSVVGCRASAEVEGDNDAEMHSKKTTTYDNGTKTTKTEVKVDK